MTRLLAKAIAGLVFSVSAAQAAEVNSPRGVVELFTSQGCSSCPAADKIIGKFAKGNEILGLSWHVNYWDYLGWKDQFATEEFTNRQYRYARAMQQPQVYTPQAVVNGRSHLVGSRESRIRDRVAAYADTERGLPVPIRTEFTENSMRVSVAPHRLASDATLWMVYFNKSHKVDISRGENGGKTLVYSNVVHELQALGMVKADGLDMEFPIAEMRRQGFDSCALILQGEDESGNPKPIVGAVVITDL